MKTYQIIYTETIAHEIFVEANSEKEAMQKFRRMEDMKNATIFSEGTVIDTQREILVDEAQCEYVSF